MERRFRCIECSCSTKCNLKRRYNRLFGCANAPFQSKGITKNGDCQCQIKEYYTMDQIDQLIENVRTFCAVLEKLRLMEGPEMLLPGRVEMYNRTLEDAYTAYAQVETAVDEWGQELEYQHMRLDEGVKQYGQTEQDRKG